MGSSSMLQARAAPPLMLLLLAPAAAAAKRLLQLLSNVKKERQPVVGSARVQLDRIARPGAEACCIQALYSHKKKMYLVREEEDCYWP